MELGLRRPGLAVPFSSSENQLLHENPLAQHFKKKGNPCFLFFWPQAPSVLLDRPEALVRIRVTKFLHTS